MDPYMGCDRCRTTSGDAHREFPLCEVLSGPPKPRWQPPNQPRP
jgi:hypothetical protein